MHTGIPGPRTLCLASRVPTIAEVLRLARRRIWAGSRVGVYVETKEPAFHVAKQLDLERRCGTRLYFAHEELRPRRCRRVHMTTDVRRSSLPLSPSHAQHGVEGAIIEGTSGARAAAIIPVNGFGSVDFTWGLSCV